MQLQRVARAHLPAETSGVQPAEQRQLAGEAFVGEHGDGPHLGGGNEQGPGFCAVIGLQVDLRLTLPRLTGTDAMRCAGAPRQRDVQLGHPAIVATEEGEKVYKDANGAILQDGDTVTVIKDLKLKGSSLVVKVGTKVKNIRLVDSDHDIDCKIDGFGAMKLKSEFVKKV